MKKFVIANWKMNPEKKDTAVSLALDIKEKLSENLENTKIVICPPSIFIDSVSEIVKDDFYLGGQDIYPAKDGAYTGETSPKMLKGFGAEFVIIGHSERRQMGEKSSFILQKIVFALENGLTPIYCIGEKENDFELAKEIIKTQIDNELGMIDQSVWHSIIIAYEPVWAIGKDAKRVASISECARMIDFIKKYLAEKRGLVMAVLYGGSVNSESVSGFVTEGLADGVLVGRASLDPVSFSEIVKKVDNINKI